MKNDKLFNHEYLPHSSHEINEMMKIIGVETIDEMFTQIPPDQRFLKDLKLPSSLTEKEVLSQTKRIFAQNISLENIHTFLGSGIYYRYIPSAVSSLVNRSEFVTAYTPYAPEISQGMLQALWEYQSMIAEITGLDYVNSSMYDMSTALGESALMCTRVSRGKKTIFMVPSYINPEKMQTLRTYARGADLEVRCFEYDDNLGTANINDIENIIKTNSGKISGLYLESPNYFGNIEENVREIVELIHNDGGLFVSGFDPIFSTLLAPPSELGADIAIGEGQSLGMAMNYGGPGLGLFAVKNDKKLMRSMPGRIIGLTTEKDSDKRAFCMTLQTREQHIRREKATSNICTNNALCALNAAVYLSLLGYEGLKNVAEISIARSNYLSNQLGEIDGIQAPLFQGTHLGDFVLKIDSPKITQSAINGLTGYLLENSIHGGTPLDSHFPKLENSFLWSVTEMNSLESLDILVTLMQKFISKGGDS